MSGAGRFVWYELLTNDPEAAKAFYGAVAGWDAEPFAGGEPYEIWSAHETQFGGVMKVGPDCDQPFPGPHWWAHVAVDDVDASVQHAVALGGAVRMPPTDIPDVGRFAVITDPQGAVVALFHSTRGSMPRPDCTKPGFVVWHELSTTDSEAARQFYAEMFGWRHVESLDMGAMGSYLTFRHAADSDSTPTGGMYDAAKISGDPPAWLFYVNVDALDGALERVRAHGGTVLNGPTEVPGGGRAAQCRDPQGAGFGLFSLA